METKDKILIVEDDDTIAAFLVAVLNANGFDTIRAGMGREAVSLISSHRSEEHTSELQSRI